MVLIKCKREEEYAFIGELSLNAKIRACNGVLPMVIAARQKGVKNIIVPMQNLKEASLVNGINVFAFENLNELVGFLEGEKEYQINVETVIEIQEKETYGIDFKEVQGQDSNLAFVFKNSEFKHF